MEVWLPGFRLNSIDERCSESQKITFINRSIWVFLSSAIPFILSSHNTIFPQLQNLAVLPKLTYVKKREGYSKYLAWHVGQLREDFYKEK